MKPSMSPTRRLALSAGLLVAALMSCGREVTGPGTAPVNAFKRFAAVAFSPQYETAVQGTARQAALTQVAFDHVRITLRREDGTIALDTVVTFAAGLDELVLSLSVSLPASAPASGVPLTLNLNYVNAAGETVFSGGPVIVMAIPSTPGGTPPPPVQVPVHYTGTGSNATAVSITPRIAAGIAGQSASFTAQALGSTGQVIAGTPIVFSSSDPGVVRIGNPSSGSADFVGRGTAFVYALLLTGQKDSAVVTVTLPATAIALVSGGDQVANAGSTLPQPVVAQVRAVDGVGVAGVTVTFAVASGAGVITPASAVSGANGQVSASWKLGPAAGAQSMTVTSAGLTGSPITVNATALAIVPSKLVMTTPPVNGKAGNALAAVAVTVQDALGNTVTAFTGDVSVAIGNNPGSATLGGTTTVKAVNGVATFSNLTLNRPGTAYTLAFSSSGLSGVISSAFDVTAGNAAKLVFGPMTSTADAGNSMGSVLVMAQDADGNTVTSFTGVVTVAIGTNPGASTLSGTLARAAVAGVATFNDLSLNKKGPSYTLVASAAGMTGGTSAPFNVAPGAPSGLSIVSGNGQAMASGSLLSPIAVRLHDALGNGIEGASIAFAVTSGGGTLSSATAITDADGVARVSWTIGAGPQTMTATYAGLPSTIVTATSTSAILTWTGAISTAWNVAGNWSPAFVPTAVDAVTIPVTTNAPIISAPASVISLVVATGATLTNNSTLTVNGSVDAGTTITGTGSVILAGASGTVMGLINQALTVFAGTHTLSGYVEVTGNVTVSGAGAVLTLNGNELYVTGNFATANGGAVDLTNSMDYLYVAGSAVFGGGSTAGKLTLGTLEVVQDFTQSGAANSFAPGVDFLTTIGAPYATAALRSSRNRGARSLGVAALRDPAVELARNARMQRLAPLRAAQAERLAKLDRRAAAYASRGMAAPSRELDATRNNSADQATTRLGHPARVYSGTSVITFTNPASSFFGTLYLHGPAYSLASDVVVTGQLQTESSYPWVHSSSTTARKLTSHGAAVSNLSFDNVSWNMLDGSDIWTMDYVDFNNMDPTADQFTIARTSDERAICDCSSYYELYYWSFYTTPTTGNYIKATDTNGGPHLLDVRMYMPDPATNGGHVSTAGGAVITDWPATAVVTWTGATSNVWSVASNWSGGAVPTSTDDVLIPASAATNPYIQTDIAGSVGYAHNLTIESGRTINLNCGTELRVYGNVIAPLGAAAVGTCEGEAIHLVGDGTAGGNTVVGNFEMVTVDGNYKVSGPGNQLIVTLSWGGLLSIDGTTGGNLTINGGRVDADKFETTKHGTLTMTNAGDQLFVGGGSGSGSAYFKGGSTAGKLTAGTITILGGACLYTTPADTAVASDAFAPSGTHKVVFGGANNCVGFAVPTMSYFQDVTVNAGTRLFVETNGFNANGTLSRGAGSGMMTIDGGGTPVINNVSGLNITGGPTTFNNIGLRLVVGTANATLNTVTFTGFVGYMSPILRVMRNSPEIITFNALDFSAVTGLSLGGVFLDNFGTATVNVRGSNPLTGIPGTYPGSYTGTVSWIP
jgi:Bacterial Ig-like domain (group 1)